MAKYGLFLKAGAGSIIDPAKLAQDQISFAYIRAEDRYQHDDSERSQFVAALTQAGIPYGFWYCMDWWSGDISGLKQSIEIWNGIGKRASLHPMVCLFPSEVGTSYPPSPMPTATKMLFELQACMDDLVLKYGVRLPFCATPSMIRSLGNLTNFGFLLKSPLCIFNWNTDTPVIAPWSRYLFQVFKGDVVAPSFTSSLGVIRFPYTDEEFEDWVTYGWQPTSDPVIPVDVPISDSPSPSPSLPIPDTNIEALVSSIYNDVHFIREFLERIARSAIQ